MTKKDLIIKLTKLANNNPNEHEANSAARRVCRLLEECNFIFDISSTELNNPTTDSITWNDVKRATKPYWRSTPYQATEKQQATWDDIATERERIRRERKGQEDYFNSVFNEFKIPYNKTRPKERPEPRVRKCIQCGKEELTRRITAVFRCNECEWNLWRQI